MCNIINIGVWYRIEGVLKNEIDNMDNSRIKIIQEFLPQKIELVTKNNGKPPNEKVYNLFLKN